MAVPGIDERAITSGIGLLRAPLGLPLHTALLPCHELGALNAQRQRWRPQSAQLLALDLLLDPPLEAVGPVEAGDRLAGPRQVVELAAPDRHLDGRLDHRCALQLAAAGRGGTALSVFLRVAAVGLRRALHPSARCGDPRMLVLRHRRPPVLPSNDARTPTETTKGAPGEGCDTVLRSVQAPRSTESEHPMRSTTMGLAARRSVRRGRFCHGRRIR